jgi:hypothetical protein
VFILNITEKCGFKDICKTIISKIMLVSKNYSKTLNMSPLQMKIGQNGQMMQQSGHVELQHLPVKQKDRVIFMIPIILIGLKNIQRNG